MNAYIKIIINLDGAAFDDFPASEVATILRALADRVAFHPCFSPGHSQVLCDVSGIEVGYFEIAKGTRVIQY